MPVTDNNLTNSLIALKTHYEQALSEANTKASHLREQLSHVNDLLLNQFVPTQAPVKLAEPALTLEEADAQVERLALAPAPTEAPAVDTAKPKVSSRKPKAAPEPTPAAPEPGKRSPRPMLSAFAGLTRIEAIAQLLQTTPGQDVTTDQISEGLFGKLSAADHKAERKSLNTQLYKGQSQKLWQKGTAPGTFTISAPTPSESAQPTPKTPATKAKAPAPITAKRKSLPLLPAYAELTKREAIAQVLTAASGEVLHQDTIIKTLYGDLSLEGLKKERVRIKTTLLTGVTDGKWQKAAAPSSYFIKAAASAKPKKSVGRVKPQTTEAEAETAIAPIDLPTLETTPAAAKKRDSLTVLPAFEGMTKTDAIAKVLGQNLGEVLHQDTIIQMLYGDLSSEDLKKERSRMDTCLRSGVKNNRWKKSPVPASYVLEATTAGAKPKNSGRKPKEPKPQPEPVSEAADNTPREDASTPVEAPATKAKAAKSKAGRKPAVGKAKTSKLKRTEAELVEILQEADIQI